MRVIAQQFDTLDALCWRHYGRTAGVTENVLRANPGLVDLGPVLPHGHPVELPDRPAQPTKPLLQLWD